MMSPEINDKKASKPLLAVTEKVAPDRSLTTTPAQVQSAEKQVVTLPIRRSEIGLRGDFDYWGLNSLIYSALGNAYFHVSKTERSIYEHIGIKKFKSIYLNLSKNFYTAYRFNGHRLGTQPDLNSKMVIAESFSRHDEILQLGITAILGRYCFRAFSSGDPKIGTVFAFSSVVSLGLTLMQRYNRGKMQKYFDQLEKKVDH